MTDRELMKMALEALTSHRITANERNNILKALRERLSQPEPYKQPEDNRLLMKAFRAVHENNPEPEPVAWRDALPGGRLTDKWESARIGDYNAGWNDYRKAAKEALEKLYTAPPKREWVGLTDEEMSALKQKSVDDGMTRLVSDFEYIRSIEAKLKEKNT